MNQIERSVPGSVLSTMTKDRIESSADSILLALHSTGASPELLLRSWATFEALARYLMPTSFLKPQSPGRVVEILAFEGYVTPSEADILRTLAVKRNRFIHGDLDQSVSNEEIAAFASVLRKLLEFDPESAEPNVAAG